MHNIKMLLFDVDGVITDSRKYIDGCGMELKSLSMKDLDALWMLKDTGYIIGCITGEDNNFSGYLEQMNVFDFVRTGCKHKVNALKEVMEKYNINTCEICYIGDGKYDIPVLKMVGMAVCPNDAIEEVKQVSTIVLKRKGGDGCIAEIYTLLCALKKEKTSANGEGRESCSLIMDRMTEHQNLLAAMAQNKTYIHCVEMAVEMIVESYRRKRKLFLCGNGGSAADAQHLAAELVGRYLLERKGLNAEALTVNTSIITALANDYDYNEIFARQLEAKAVVGDVLIGITTSGTSENIFRVFQKAKEIGVKTVLMTGDIFEGAPVLAYADCVLAVSSGNTPRIQEIHILTGHIICEIVEQKLVMGNSNG